MDEKDLEHLKEIVYKELSACGYFIGDFNIHNLQRPEGWTPQSSNSYVTMLMDLACLYNMEYEGKNYKYELIEDNQ